MTSSVVIFSDFTNSPKSHEDLIQLCSLVNSPFCVKQESLTLNICGHSLNGFLNHSQPCQTNQLSPKNYLNIGLIWTKLRVTGAIVPTDFTQLSPSLSLCASLALLSTGGSLLLMEQRRDEAQWHGMRAFDEAVGVGVFMNGDVWTTNTLCSFTLPVYLLYKPLVKVWPVIHDIHRKIKTERVSREMQSKQNTSVLKLAEITPFWGLSDEDCIYTCTFCLVPSCIVLCACYLLSALMFLQLDITHKLSSSTAEPP